MEGSPIVIEFVGDTMAVKYSNRRVSFFQIKVVAGKTAELQIVKFGPTDIQCDLMLADIVGRKFVLLSKSELCLVTVGTK